MHIPLKCRTLHIFSRCRTKVSQEDLPDIEVGSEFESEKGGIPKEIKVLEHIDSLSPRSTPQCAENDKITALERWQAVLDVVRKQVRHTITFREGGTTKRAKDRLAAMATSPPKHCEAVSHAGVAVKFMEFSPNGEYLMTSG